MKKLKTKMLSVIMAISLAFGIGFAPVAVSAEETTETPVESTETVEMPENTDDTTEGEETSEVVSYYAQMAENKGVRFDFLDSANVQCVMFLDGVEVATVNATYTKVKDVADIYAMGDYLGSFRLNSDGTATELYQYEYDSEEVPETEETGENKAEITLDDLLAFVGKIAEEEGLGDEWQKAVENLRLAISEKKLDVNIVLDALLLIVLGAYAIYKVIGGIVRGIASKKSTATVLSEIQTVEKSSAAQTKAVNAQTEAINALAETDTQVVENVEKENAKLNALAAAQVGTNAAIRCLIRGIGMSGAVKDEAYRALNNSDEICDKAQK